MRTLLLIILSCTFSFADEWVIGLDADMSSVAKEGGVAIQQGIELAIADINERGGVLGKPVTLQIRDHRGNPARGIANLKAFNKLENLIGVVGGVHTPVAIAEMPFIHEAPLVYLGPWAAGTPVIQNSFTPNFAFRLSVRDEWAGKVILSQAKEDNCPAVRLLLERTGWGRSNEKSMKMAGQELSLPVSGIEWFNWNSDILDIMVQKVVEAGDTCVALVANTPEGVDIIKAISDLPEDQRPRVYSHWGITGGNFIEQIGLDALSNVDLKYLQTLAFDAPKTDEGRALVANYKTTYGEVAGHNAFNGVAHAYDLTQLLALAVENAGTNDPREVQKSLENIDEYSGVMKTYAQPFSQDNHEALNTADYLMLEFNEKGFGQFNE